MDKITDILKNPEIVSVEASAGTGKTTNLALRYIKILLKDYKPENVVAVTFTNKATNEMKEKIINFLKKRALNIREAEDYLNFINPKKGEEILENILSKYHNFRITTIDSFLSMLGKNFSFDFKFPPDPEMVLDDYVFIENGLKEYFENVKAKTKEEKDFIEYFRKILRWKEDIKWNFFEIVLEDLNNLLMIEKKTGKDIILPQNLNFLDELEEEVKKIVAKIGTDKFARKEVEEFVSGKRSLLSFKLKLLKDYQNKEDATEVMELYKKYLSEAPKNLKFPSIEIYEKLKFFINDFMEKEGVFVLDFLLRKLKGKVKECSFSPRYIYISERIKHFLIDEFQDTSPLQWAILMPLIENCLSEGGTFFYVGDKKQAIYEFRGGDYKIFEKPKKSFPTTISAREGILSTSFRSKKEIIDFVKETFSEENLKKAIEKKKEFEENSIKEVLNHFKIVKDSKTSIKGKGYVKVISLPENAEELNAEEIREEIRENLIDLLNKEILKYYDYEDIAILVRKNSEARDILIKLLENNIPAISPSALGLFSSNTIIEIICFLKFLNNSEDDLNFAQVLISEIFLKKTGTKKEDWLDYLLKLKKDKNKIIFNNFKKDHNKIYNELFKEILLRSNILSPYEITNKIYELFDIFNNFPEQEGFFYAFLEYLSFLQDKGIVSLNEVIKEIENISGDEPKVLFPVKTPQIKVMTIHKAKGLEFPVVIIPFLSIYISSKDMKYYDILEEEEKVVPYYLNSDLVEKSGFTGIYNNIRIKYLIEELNVLYVAVTRAKEALYVIVPQYKDGNNIFLVEKGKDKTIGELPEKKLKKISKNIEKERQRFPKGNWAEKISRDFVDLNIYQNKERYEKIKKGIELHNKIPKGNFEEIPEEFLETINPEGFIKRESEKEIIDSEGNIYRTDLIIYFKDKVRVVDFKFGEKRKEDLEQIKYYINLIKEIEKKEVEGFLLYFEKREVQKINA